MASSLAVKRFLSSSLLSRSLRPAACSASRSFNTNALRQFDEHSNDRNVDDVDRRSDPRLARRGDLFSGSKHPLVSASRGAGVRPCWEARETDDALLLRVDMPGLGKEDVKLSVEQNTLIIKGEGAKESEEEEGARRYTSRIDLPDLPDKLYKIDQIKAEMKNGVLKIAVPKMKEEERSMCLMLGLSEMYMRVLVRVE